MANSTTQGVRCSTHWYNTVELWQQSFSFNCYKSCSYERTKHVKIDCHFIREKQASSVIKPQYIPTKHQAADIFTKPLSVSQHQHLLSKLGVLSHPPHPAWGGRGYWRTSSHSSACNCCLSFLLLYTFFLCLLFTVYLGCVHSLLLLLFEYRRICCGVLSFFIHSCHCTSRGYFYFAYVRSFGTSFPNSIEVCKIQKKL